MSSVHARLIEALEIELTDDNGVDEIRRLLKLWSLWTKQGAYPGAKGFPKSCAFIYAGQNRGHGNQIEADDPEAIKVERGMCQLRMYNKRAYFALVFKYLQDLKNKEAAGLLGYKQVNRYLALREAGEHFIAAWMTTKTF